MVIQKGIRQNDFNFLDGVLQKLSTSSHGGKYFLKYFNTSLVFIVKIKTESDVNTCFQYKIF